MSCKNKHSGHLEKRHSLVCSAATPLHWWVHAQRRIRSHRLAADHVYVEDRTGGDVTQWVETSSPAHFQSLWVDMSAGCKLTRVRARACCVILRSVSFDCLLCSAKDSLPVLPKWPWTEKCASILDPLLFICCVSHLPFKIAKILTSLWGHNLVQLMLWPWMGSVCHVRRAPAEKPGEKLPNRSQCHSH